MDAAKCAGLHRTCYARYEDAASQHYDLDKLARIASLFEVDVTDLLGDYTRFLYDGQGQQVKAIRKALGLTSDAMAALLGVTGSTIRSYESGRIRMWKPMYEKMMVLWHENGRSA